MSQIVYPNGNSGSISVGAGKSIAVYTQGVANVSRVLSFTNQPDSVSLLGIVNGGQTVFGSYASGAMIVIEAGASPVYYEVGSAPVVRSLIESCMQVDPVAKTTAVTLTGANLLSGIITGTHAAGATQAYTLPTGTLMDASSDFAVNDSFDWSLINLSAAALDTITLTAGTDHTIVGNPIVQSAHASTGGIYGNSSLWRTRKTAANTFVTYRIA